MNRSSLLACVLLLLLAPASPVMGQASNDLAALLARNQYDLAADGRQFLLEEVSRARFLLVGGLHGDNETQALVQVAMNGLGDGPTLVLTEMSPWAANRLFPARAEPTGIRFRGADIEEAQLPVLIGQVAAANPENRFVQEMLALVKGGYRRALARDLLALARQAGDVKSESVGGVPLPTLLVRTLEVEVDRSTPETSGLASSLRRERVMKDFFMTHYRQMPSDGKPPKVVAVFGRNHLHRGIDRRGVSTLGNFIAELAVVDGVESFHVALFAAGGSRSTGFGTSMNARTIPPSTTSLQLRNIPRRCSR